LREISGYSFITLGDWGGANISDDVSDNVYAVAKAMIDKANGEENYPSFLVNTGDNFYWCGITSTTDPQIDIDFVEPYKDLNLDFFTVLGNHEYGYNVQAQLDYAKNNLKWNIDDRYYTKRILMDSTLNVYASFIFLDTSPCVADYRKNDPSAWDPCSTQYPTCSPGATDDDFEGPCQFHENILTQNCTTQFEWFKDVLLAVPEDDWLIVVGHHPIDEIDVHDFTTELQNHGFSIYLNGHAHTLTHYKIDNSGVYVTSGAGSLVDTNDQNHSQTKAKVLGQDIEAYFGMSNHTYQTIFNKKIAGFTYHYFDSDFTSLTTEIVSYTGETVYKFTSKKDGSYL
jgi:hypothetical protein